MSPHLLLTILFQTLVENKMKNICLARMTSTVVDGVDDDAQSSDQVPEHLFLTRAGGLSVCDTRDRVVCDEPKTKQWALLSPSTIVCSFALLNFFASIPRVVSFE